MTVAVETRKFRIRQNCVRGMGLADFWGGGLRIGRVPTVSTLRFSGRPFRSRMPRRKNPVSQRRSFRNSSTDWPGNLRVVCFTRKPTLVPIVSPLRNSRAVSVIPTIGAYQRQRTKTDPAGPGHRVSVNYFPNATDPPVLK